MLEFCWIGDGFELRAAGDAQPLLRHHPDNPALTVGTGSADVAMLKLPFSRSANLCCATRAPSPPIRLNWRSMRRVRR
jgi:hypothetical protein